MSNTLEPDPTAETMAQQMRGRLRTAARRNLRQMTAAQAMVLIQSRGMTCELCWQANGMTWLVTVRHRFGLRQIQQEAIGSTIRGALVLAVTRLSFEDGVRPLNTPNTRKRKQAL